MRARSRSMRILDSTVTTRSGYVPGPKPRIEPLVALKTMTISPAYRHFEEKTKGWIEAGKVAARMIVSDTR